MPLIFATEHDRASHNIALQNRCFAPLHQAPLNCALAFLCTAFPFLALLCHSFAIHSVTLPLPRLANLCCSVAAHTRVFRRRAVAVLFNSLLFLCHAYLSPTPPLLFRAHQGDSFRCPAIARHCFSILRLHYAKHLPAAPLQRYASLHFSIALPRYASPREASAVLLVPKQNSAWPMQFLAVRRLASSLLCLAVLRFSFATQCST